MGAGLMRLQSTKALLKMNYSFFLKAELEFRHSVGGCTGKRCAICKKLKSFEKTERAIAENNARNGMVDDEL